MTGRYAKETSVDSFQSRADIERALTRYGADAFGYMADGGEVQLAFRIGGRRVRINAYMPNPEEFALTETGRARDAKAMTAAHEQACRARWRALLLVIKAKLEAVECGISTVEREFLADIVLGDGRTIYEQTRPQIEAAYRDGAVSPLKLIAG